MYITLLHVRRDGNNLAPAQTTSKPKTKCLLACFNTEAFVLSSWFSSYFSSFARHRTHRRAVSGRWSCCGEEDAAATGCAPRPHKPKEIMISVRAEGGPSVLVGNTEVCCWWMCERFRCLLLSEYGCQPKSSHAVYLRNVYWSLNYRPTKPVQYK